MDTSTILLLCLITFGLAIFVGELLGSILIGFAEFLGAVFGGSSYSSSNHYVPPKKIYKKKAKWIEDLLKKKIAFSETVPTLYIHDNYKIKGKFNHLTHEKYLEFLSFCDVIDENDGHITNVEILLIGIVKGYAKLTPVVNGGKEGRVFNYLLDSHLNRDKN